MNILVFLTEISEQASELLNIATYMGKNNNNLKLYTISLFKYSYFDNYLNNWNINTSFILNQNNCNFLYSLYLSDSIEKIIKKMKINIIIMGNSLFELELAPYIAQGIDFNYIPNISSYSIKNKKIRFNRFLYGTKAIEDSIYDLTNIICTFNKNKSKFEISNIKYNIKFENINAKSIVPYIFIDKNIKIKEKYPLETSRIVIGVGKGIGGEKNFKMIEELAKTIGATIGVTRSVVDNGWRPEYEKIGQTGKIIKPQLYIAIGLSGAMQHITGIQQSEHIIAINNNPNAEIFRYSDLGIVGDLFEVVPKLIKYFNSL